jgi:hypothetical protein
MVAAISEIRFAGKPPNWACFLISSSVSPYLFATVYAGLGENDKAIEFLEEALGQRSLEFMAYIKGDLRLDNLRSDPRF